MTHPDEHHFFQDRNMPVPNSRSQSAARLSSPLIARHPGRTTSVHSSHSRRAITACFPEHCGLTVCGCGLPTPTTSSLGSRSIFLAPRQYLDVHAVPYVYAGEQFLLSPAFMDPFTASVCMSCMCPPSFPKSMGKECRDIHTYVHTEMQPALTAYLTLMRAGSVVDTHACPTHPSHRLHGGQPWTGWVLDAIPTAS